MSEEKKFTQVFEYKGIVGIVSGSDFEGVLAHPGESGSLGFVVEAKEVEISEEAIAVLEKIPVSRDAIGDVDVFQSGKGLIFGWMGGSLKVVDPSSGQEGSRDYKPSLLREHAKVVPNNPPKEFIEFVDNKGKE